MEHLAAASGITKSSIYHHVPGKEALLRLALDRAVNALFAVLEELGAAAGRQIDRVEYVLRQATTVLVEELPYVTLLLRVRGNTSTERWAIARRHEFDRQVSTLVSEAARAGELRSDVDAGLATRLLFGMLTSVTEWYRPDGSTTPAELADALAGIAFGGLGSTDAPSTTRP